MSNSSLISCTILSPNHSGKRTHAIDTVSIHCMAGNLSVESCGYMFAQKTREASSQYGIGSDGRIALYVDEANRSWCTSSRANDQRAVTIEVANTSASDPWPCSDKAYAALLDLVTDICRRNGKRKVVWIADKAKALAYQPAADEMILTVHRWFAAKACPGNWLFDRHTAIAAEVNKRLGGTGSSASENPQTAASALEAGTKLTLNGVKLYKSSAVATESGTRTGTFYVWSKDAIKGRIRITNKTGNVGVSGQVTGWISVEDAKAAAKAAAAPSSNATQTQAPAQAPATFTPYLVRIIASILNVRRGPGTTYAITTQIRRGEVYTIVGEENGWGKLKSGAGWIYLGYAEKK